MAGIDKMNEFYTCAERFAHLAQWYAPENLPVGVMDAMKLISEFFQNDLYFVAFLLDPRKRLS